jgi:predicted RNA-binding protein YlxR (DUF448 family)
LGCGKKGLKDDFLRVVRLSDGNVVVTQDRKVHGRSAYVCPSEGCIKTAVKKIDKAIKINLTEERKLELKEELLSLVRQQGEDE